jgi:chromosome segregation ATPase
MGKRAVERKLRKTSSRLKRLRDELAVIDEQLAHLVDDTEDKSLRALVAESPSAAVEHREAKGHSEAMADHRRHVIAEIGALETQQDQLLDELRLL